MSNNDAQPLTQRQIAEAMEILKNKKYGKDQPRWRQRLHLIVADDVECPICKKYEENKK